jgi:hypothetical protein
MPLAAAAMREAMVGVVVADDCVSVLLLLAGQIRKGKKREGVLCPSVPTHAHSLMIRTGPKRPHPFGDYHVMSAYRTACVWLGSPRNIKCCCFFFLFFCGRGTLTCELEKRNLTLPPFLYITSPFTLPHTLIMSTVFKQQKSKRDKAEGIVAKTTEDTPVFRNKQRVLLLSSRGITSR